MPKASSAAQFCLEVCAKRAVLTGAMRRFLPGSFGVGLGVSPLVAAPVIRVNPVSAEGKALIADCVSEPECAWVHIRCPRSIFPVEHSSHLLPVGDGAEGFVDLVGCLLSVCKQRSVPWSFEAPARSCVWDHAVIGRLKPSAVQVNLCHFGHVFRAPIMLSCSLPGTFDSLSSLCVHKHASTFMKVDAAPAERKCCVAMAECISSALRVPPQFPDLSANKAAQVLSGSQPSKLPFRVMPEFKCVLKVGKISLPPLDAKGCLKDALQVQGMTVPAGSKLLPPSFFELGDRMGKAAANVHSLQVITRDSAPPVITRDSSPPVEAASPEPSSVKVSDKATVMSTMTSQTPPETCRTKVMSSMTQRTPPAPPKAKRVNVMSSMTGPGCSVHDSTSGGLGETDCSARSNPVSPLLVGFRPPLPSVGVAAEVDDPVSPALIGFRSCTPASASSSGVADQERTHMAIDEVSDPVSPALIGFSSCTPASTAAEVDDPVSPALIGFRSCTPSSASSSGVADQERTHMAIDEVSDPVSPALIGFSSCTPASTLHSGGVSRKGTQPKKRACHDTPLPSGSCTPASTAAEVDDPVSPALIGFRSCTPSSASSSGVADQERTHMAIDEVSDPVSPALIGFSSCTPASTLHSGGVSRKGTQPKKRACHDTPLPSVALRFSSPDLVSGSAACEGAQQSRKGKAEAFAKSLSGQPNMEEVCCLFDLVPGEKPARGGIDIRDAREKAWTTGAYVHGGVSGLRRNAVLFPETTRAILRHVLPRLRSIFGHVTFSALAIFSNVMTPLHADTNNAKGLPNYVLPLSVFKGGGVWLEQEGGPVEVMHGGSKLHGIVLPVDSGPCAFLPDARHCTQDWEGSRIVCVCFTPAGFQRLSSEDVDHLVSLGFPLAKSATERVQPAEASQRSGLHRSSGKATAEEEHAFGMYYSEAEFVREAVCVGHPRSLCGALPYHIADAVEALASRPHHEVRARRNRWLSRWTKRAAEIQANPDPKWNVSDKAMARVLCKKRLQLLHEIIAEEGYPDGDLAHDIHKGFDLVGRCPTSGVLPGKLVPATLRAEDVQACAPRVQAALKASLGSSGDHATDLELWDKTIAEASKGWLEGPYEWDTLGADEVPSHRFPLRQGEKLRPIDDYTLSGVNHCVTTLEAPTVDTADVASAMAAKLCWSLLDRGRPARLLGRSYDLTSAYRQLCVSRASRPFAIIAVYDPHRKCVVWFRQVCLPFGGKASVNGFIRCGRCIQWIANRCLWIAVSSYYDDYIVLSDEALERSTGEAMDLLFTLLGWEFDREGAKADNFSGSVSALGIHLCLDRTSDGVVLVDNTDKRKSDLDGLISKVLGSGCLDMAEGLTLRGKLSFADAQVMGRAGRYALKVISNHLHAVPFRKGLCADAVCALKFMRERLRDGTPRFVPKPLDRCFLIFTDASFHDDLSGGLGGVLVSPLGSVVSWFDLPLSKYDTAPFLAIRNTCIGELETIAVPIAYDVWAAKLRKTESVNYVDNTGAQCALVKGCSASMQITRLCQYCATIFEKNSMLVWHARVPSSSNIADSPSRQVESALLPLALKCSSKEVESAWARVMGAVGLG